MQDEEPQDVRDIISLRIAVPDSCDGWRLDHFIKFRISRLSRTKIQAIIAEQITFEDGRRVRPASRVRAGETIHLDRPAPVEPDVPRHFEILHTDPAFYVIDKPAGLPIHCTAKYWRNTLTTVLRERFPDERLQVCHRLDRETSGVLLVARSKPAASVLKQAFANRLIKKEYLALVHGLPDPAQGCIDHPLALLDTPTHMMMGVVPGGMTCKTTYTVLETWDHHALVKAMPETGRQHQIRVHLASLGHPIVGDKIYKAGESLFMQFCDNGMTPELLEAFDGLPRQALHAHRLTFPHPVSKIPVTVVSPWPEDLRNHTQALPRTQAAAQAAL